MLAALTLSALAALAVANPSPNPLHSLVARQSVISPQDIPEQCSTQCTPMVDTLNKCSSSTDVTCGCDSTTKGQIESCFACLTDLVPSLKDQMDQALQAYTEGCAAAASGDSSPTSTGNSSGTGAVVQTATSASASSTSTSPSSPSDGNNSSSNDNPLGDTSGNTDAAAPVHPSILMAALTGAFVLGGAFIL